MNEIGQLLMWIANLALWMFTLGLAVTAVCILVLGFRYVRDWLKKQEGESGKSTLICVIVCGLLAVLFVAGAYWLGKVSYNMTDRLVQEASLKQILRINR